MEATDELKQICSELLDRYKKAISASGHSASGELENSASYRININGKYVEIIFKLQDYWKYLENSTKPHFPPLQAIEQWITVKHIIPTTDNGKVPTTRQLAYLIGRDISKNGTKATKLLQKTIDNSGDLINLMVNEIIRQLEEEIKEEQL